MSNRITWRNVAAPDFSSAVASQKLVGDMLGSGFDGLAQVGASIRQRQKESISAQAMAAAQGINNISDWDRMMSGSQGFGGLGVNASDLTPEAMQYLQGRRAGILADNQAVADTAFTNAGTNYRNAQTAGQHLLNEGYGIDNRQAAFNYDVAQYGFGRRVADDQRADAALALQSQATALAGQYADQSVSLEEAIHKATKDNLDPSLEAQVIANLRGQDAAQYATAPFQDSFNALDPALRTENMVFDSAARQIELIGQDNALQRNYNAAMYKMTGSDGNALDIALRELYAAKPSEAGEELNIDQLTARVVGQLNTLGKDYPGIPRDMIAAMMADHLRRGGFLWREIKVDTDGMRDVLDQLSEPGVQERLHQNFLHQQELEGQLGSAVQLHDDARKAYDVAVARGLDTTPFEELMQKAISSVPSSFDLPIEPQPQPTPPPSTVPDPTRIIQQGFQDPNTPATPVDPLATGPLQQPIVRTSATSLIDSAVSAQGPGSLSSEEIARTEAYLISRNDPDDSLSWDAFVKWLKDNDAYNPGDKPELLMDTYKTWRAVGGSEALK